jgi:hypothetical protein
MPVLFKGAQQSVLLVPDTPPVPYPVPLNPFRAKPLNSQRLSADANAHSNAGGK